MGPKLEIRSRVQDKGGDHEWFSGDISLSFCPWLCMMMQLVVQAKQIGRDETGEESSPARDRKSGIERNGPGREKSRVRFVLFHNSVDLSREEISIAW